MLRFITQHRVLFLILLLVLLGLQLLSTGLRQKTDLGFFGRAVLTVYAPVYQVLSWPFEKLADLLRHYVFLVFVEDTNERLRQQNAGLKQQLVRAEELRLENERLKELLQMRREDSQPVAYAQVIGRSGREDFHVLVVNAGSSKGVAKGMAVATPDGLVGFVTAVAPFAAKVMMLTDATARVDVVLQRTRHRAILFGRGRPLCTLEYLDPGTDAAEGDRVVASGADGLAPKGVAVGVVQQVQRGDFGVVQSIVIEPAVDFSTVEDVAILPIQPGAVELLP